jgi:hypothetical protein
MGVESGDMVGHKRFLALFSGGMLPIISLSFLHMLVKFEEEEKKKKEESQPKIQQIEEKNIDELSILAGKEEAKIESEKFVPTEEQLAELERTLKEINQNKFKSLEETPEVITKEEFSNTEETTIEEPEVIQQEENEATIKRLSYINRNG